MYKIPQITDYPHIPSQVHRVFFLKPKVFILFMLWGHSFYLTWLFCFSLTASTQAYTNEAQPANNRKQVSSLLLMPLVVKKTKGMNEADSTSLMWSLYSFFVQLTFAKSMGMNACSCITLLPRGESLPH